MSASAGGASEASLSTISALETREWRARLFLAAAVGILVGALLGALIFSASTSDTTATSYLRLTQQADLVAVAGGASQTTPTTQEIQEGYVAGEVAFLSGEGFAQAVGDKLGKSEPATFEVTQNGNTAVVSISSTAPSASEAIRTVGTAVDLYRQHLAQRADEQLRAVLPVLAQWTRDEPGVERREQLRWLRERLELQANPSSMLSVLQPPTANDPSTNQWLVGAVLGALFLGSLFPSILMRRRRRAGRLSSDPEIVDAIDAVLVPAVPLRQPPRHSWGRPQATLARTLWAQLPASAAAPRVVVVLGASESSGSATVAALLGFAAAEEGPARTITLAELDGDELTLPNHGATAVIDVGVLGESRLVSQAIASATDLLVAARLGVDTVAQTLAVRSAAENATLVAVFTHRPWWSRATKPKKRTPPEPAPAEA
ncbi:hypothetical protein [Mycolicibacterium duvalii]|uniref:hypothetical protein n=1 Tax=Mycolicibacterium duvalii TaxID=39688 RepID=UPI001054B346|nr:hypothetical protein [Mycolicibacterium duvalii]MCV7370640.1 hypothetical protein [Mycolicibacterium duvalii]